jgi:hypothetical protein
METLFGRVDLHLHPSYSGGRILKAPIIGIGSRETRLAYNSRPIGDAYISWCRDLVRRGLFTLVGRE